MVDLKGYRVEELTLVNKIQEDVEFGLTHTENYSVGYSGDNICVGKLELLITASDEKIPFKIKAVILAQFKFDDGDSQQYIHVSSFNELFPYIRMIITNLTTSAGMASLIIPKIDISSAEIKPA